MELATTRERSRTGHTRREPAQGVRQGPYIIEIGGEIVSNAVFIRAEELAQELEISKAKAYKMIRQWNEELRTKGYATVNGRVSRQYYLEHMYGRLTRREMIKCRPTRTKQGTIGTVLSISRIGTTSAKRR